MVHYFPTTNMALKQDEKKELLSLFKELVNYLSLKEVKEFENIHELMDKTITPDEIREARVRDIYRHVEEIEEHNKKEDVLPARLYYEMSSMEQAKVKILLRIQHLCPQFVPLFQKLEYTMWPLEKQKTITKDEVMISDDWDLMKQLCETLVK